MSDDVDLAAASEPLDRDLAAKLHQLYAHGVREHGMVWLGSLSGWTIGVRDLHRDFRSAGIPEVAHRCGYSRPVTGPDTYLANVIVEVVLPHLISGCIPGRDGGERDG